MLILMKEDAFPHDHPFVSSEQGTELVIEHIEKYWCPTTTRAELLAGL